MPLSTLVGKLRESPVQMQTGFRSGEKGSFIMGLRITTWNGKPAVPQGVIVNQMRL